MNILDDMGVSKLSGFFLFWKCIYPLKWYDGLWKIFLMTCYEVLLKNYHLKDWNGAVIDCCVHGSDLSHNHWVAYTFSSAKRTLKGLQKASFSDSSPSWGLP